MDALQGVRYDWLAHFERIETTMNQTVLIEKIGKVGVLTLNRPEALNALNQEMLQALVQALQDFDADSTVTVMLIKGSEKAFAAGADIKFMADATAQEMRQNGFIDLFAEIGKIKKPIIASVSGYALGGGFEVVLSCDIILAAESAVFGLPEVTIGVIPGGGGTQRLVRIVGKYLAMEMVLNNRKLNAHEALGFGLVNHVFANAMIAEESLRIATEISLRAPIAMRAAKSAMNTTFENGLTEGLEAERTLFYNLFETQDQKEGMKAFQEKRKPNWVGE